MATALLLGLVQGIAEWLPVSSEGVVTAVQVLLLKRELAEAVSLAVWLHLGTALSALVAFRSEFWGLAREALTVPRRPSPLLTFLLLATLVSVAVGLPFLLFLGEIPPRWGMYGMLALGVFLLITGVLQLTIRGAEEGRGTRVAGWREATLAGLAQGFAAVPGLSRSGLTITALLFRGVEKRDAFRLSFIMSVPVTLGAALFAGLEGGFLVSPEGLASAGVAFVVGLVVLRALMALATRLNFGLVALVLGVLVILGSLPGLLL